MMYMALKFRPTRTVALVEILKLSGTTEFTWKITIVI